MAGPRDRGDDRTALAGRDYINGPRIGREPKAMPRRLRAAERSRWAQSRDWAASGVIGEKGPRAE